MSANRARAIFIELVAQVPPGQWEGRLADLAVVRRDRRGVDDHPALSVLVRLGLRDRL